MSSVNSDATASIGIAFTRDRKFFLCNPRFAAMFGWEKARAMDMGPMGTYQTFGQGGATEVGGMKRAVASGGMVEIKRTVIEDGKKKTQIALGRLVDYDAVAGDVVLSGGPPYIQDGDRIMAICSGEMARKKRLAKNTVVAASRN